jgi:hypothetical protein
MKIIFFFIISMLLTACAPSNSPDVGKLTKEAYQKGYDQAVFDLNLENLQNLKGHMLACQAAAVFPVVFQKLIGLDCSIDFDQFPDIKNVTANVPFKPIFMTLAVLLVCGLILVLLIPPLGRISAQWNAALQDRYSGLRTRKMTEIEAQATQIRENTLEPLRRRSEELETAIKSAEARYTAAIQRADEAEDWSDHLEAEVEALKKKVELAKATESTDDLAELLSSLGRRP